MTKSLLTSLVSVSLALSILSVSAISSAEAKSEGKHTASTSQAAPKAKSSKPRVCKSFETLGTLTVCNDGKRAMAYEHASLVEVDGSKVALVWSAVRVCRSFEVVGEDEVLLCKDGKRPTVSADYTIVRDAAGVQIFAVIHKAAKQ